MTDLATARPAPRARSTAFTVGRAARRIAVAVVICSAVSLATITVAARLLGATPLIVTSGSMEPAISTGSIVFVAERPAASVTRGDVITFDPPGPTGRVTHRVVDRERWQGGWYFTTRGDANPTDDEWRTGDATQDDRTPDGVTYRSGTALVVVAHVPFAGYVLAVLQVPLVRMLLTWGLLAFVGTLALRWIWSTPSADTPARSPSRAASPARDDEADRDAIAA